MIFSRDHVNERPGWICVVVIAMLPPFFYLAIWASVQIPEGRQMYTRTKQQDEGNIKATPTVPSFRQ
ncbi:hypothetical protein SUGI_1179120 [Cryptomeria japonica]|nr:hypothetical protein SUGI_1179120 [Cryptomeria japonica]